jgi:hypothetical protein
MLDFPALVAETVRHFDNLVAPMREMFGTGSVDQFIADFIGRGRGGGGNSRGGI